MYFKRASLHVCTNVYFFLKFCQNKYFFFWKGYSTQQRLLALLEKWKRAVDSCQMFGALLADLLRHLIVSMTKN